MDNKSIGHIISHTHWDREWRVPEWNSRWRLKVMMEKLLAVLEENPDFIFLFDGQVVSIHDYLEIYPGKRALVEKFVKNGQLQIGPWYNLPDLYPVCGEALIRNLLTGIREAGKLGGCLKIAYTTFGWGQTAQFPQIFSGFGIDKVVAGKNVSKKRAPNSEFYWESPDGSKVFATRLGVEKRANFFFYALMPALYGHKYSDDKTMVNWGKGGWLFHSAGSFVDSEITFIPDETFHPEIINTAIADAWETCKDSLVQEHVFMGNGCDSTAPDSVVDKIIGTVNNSYQDKELVYSDINTYLDTIHNIINEKGIELNTVYGELRDGPVHALSANALATRMPLKVLNRKAQDQLTRYAEPFAVLAESIGVEYPKELIDKAWHFMLLAHSHDAINGVTLDKTAEDTAYKFKQVVEISRVVTDMTACEILKKVNFNNYDEEEILLAVFNPTPRPVKQIVNVAIDVPEKNRCRRLRVFDSDNKEMLVQNIGHFSHAAPVYVQNSRALPFYCDRHDIYVETGEIPAYGYKILKVAPEEKYNKKLIFWHGTFEQDRQVSEPLSMENRYLKVMINSDGTYNVLSKLTGRQFDNLGFYENSGDAGDYWQRVKPNYDNVYYSKGKEADIYLKEDGPLVTTYVCKQEMIVPGNVDIGSRFSSKRSGYYGNIKIVTELSLKRDSQYLEIKVLIDNNAKGHRLRVGLPTFINTDQSHAMGHFNVDSRPVGNLYNNGIRDGEMGTLPMQNFVDLSDGKSGLAILNKELTEFEVSEDQSRTVYMTLLRCMDVNICTEGRCATIEGGAEGSQCLGKHEFNFSVFPHQGGWREGRTYDITERYLYQPKAYQVSKHNNGNLPDSISFLSVESSEARLSSVKRAENNEGFVARLFNPTGKKSSTKIILYKKPSKASVVNMNEEYIAGIPVDNSGNIEVEIGPYKIMTLLFEQQVGRP